MSALRIRMYNVGFGDCFLLTFGEAAEARHVLFDCGSISSGAGQVATVAEHVIDSVRDVDGIPRIALLVCTHRHRDHVGGFTHPKWKDVVVGEVWMPWTEDPQDPKATSIRNKQSGFAADLAAALGIAPVGLDADPIAAPVSAISDEATTLQALALNALTNEKAMQTLHSGFTGNPPRHFLPLKDKMCEARTLDSLLGVTFHVIGPPRDEAAIASMDPPKGGAYFNQAASGAAASPDLKAFRPKWQVERATFDELQPDSTFRREEQKLLDALAEEPGGSFAAAIDRAVNNTSLILLIQAGTQWLLFPGDAQWGAWNSALGNEQCRALMARTTFYKVGHHGSENATPRIAVDEIFQRGMVSFFSTVSLRKWPNVPREPLVDAITAKSSAIARSDKEMESKKAGFTIQPGLFIETVLQTSA